MRTKLQTFYNRHEQEINRFNYISTVTLVVLESLWALRIGDREAMWTWLAFALAWIALLSAKIYIDTQAAKDKKHDSDIDTDRLTRLSLPEVYEDYLRRKSQAQALYEAEVESLDKDYAQYLNALEEEAMEKDAS